MPRLHTLMKQIPTQETLVVWSGTEGGFWPPSGKTAVQLSWRMNLTSSHMTWEGDSSFRLLQPAAGPDQGETQERLGCKVSCKAICYTARVSMHLSMYTLIFLVGGIQNSGTCGGKKLLPTTPLQLGMCNGIRRVGRAGLHSLLRSCCLRQAASGKLP